MSQRCVQGRAILPSDQSIPRRASRKDRGPISYFNIPGACYLCCYQTMGMTGRMISGVFTSSVGYEHYDTF